MAEPERDPFDAVGEQLLATLARRSSRRVLAARLAAERGAGDLGDVLDAMITGEPDDERALVVELDRRFGFSPEHRELTELLARELVLAGDPRQRDGEHGQR